jgi:hypothetical protein|eukprot:COSAG06_NODE_3153_length_5766_cov_53.731604_3_plen_78_part_00
MPLYEDMAPWNIFFEAGKLIYIDYDTRNLHFDEAVPMAYQVTLRLSLSVYLYSLRLGPLVRARARPCPVLGTDPDAG